MNVIIYGAGATGRKILKQLSIGSESEKTNVIAFSDSSKMLWGTNVENYPVISPDEIPTMTYDKIIIATIMSYTIVEKTLHEKYNIPFSKLDTSYVSYSTSARNRWLESFAKTVYDRNIEGNVAECGVCEGNFAEQINSAFPDRTLYLFDTFEGFDERDIKIEKEHGFSEFQAGHLNLSSVEKVRKKLPHPEKAIFKKGYFPETAEGVDDKFVFVNLDFDLYKPTNDGLEFFYPKMAKGGIIIIHDFFNEGYAGIKQSVDEFCVRNSISYIPIGDEMSIAIIKY